MQSIFWKLTELIAELLAPDEREAVLGDLAESNAKALRAFAGVAGLAIRRHVLEWRSWRPWLAALGLAVPASFFLMGLSVSVSRASQELLNPTVRQITGITLGEGFWIFLHDILLLLVCSWTAGCVLGILSRRTLWLSVVFSFAPCLFCLARFRIESLSRLCLLLFLIPAAWGAWRGVRVASISFGVAVTLALGITALTIPSWGTHGAWIPNWALSWPAWYLVVTARKTV